MSRPKIKAPSVMPPVQIPEVSKEPEDWAVKQAKRRRGFEKTLLTGAKTPKLAPKTFLGVGNV